MTLTPARSILPNSPHSVGKEQTTDYGKFQIEWVPAIDSHVLFYEGPAYGGVIDLAAHHNGHCCQEVIDRIRKGDVGRVKAQLQYILDCGGVAMNATVIDNIMGVDTNARLATPDEYRTREQKLKRRSATGKVMVAFRMADGHVRLTQAYKVGPDQTNEYVLSLCTEYVQQNWVAFYDAPENF